MKLDQDILRILSGLQIDGVNVKITEQLDRKLYVKVNEVLETLGGKWSKKQKAHVFAENPQASLDEVIDFGELETSREKQKADGFFETPPDLARKLVEMADVQTWHFVLEPSAGKGAIVRAALELGANVTAVERSLSRRDHLRLLYPTMDVLPFVEVWAFDDFMDVNPEAVHGFPRVVMNPPFLKSGKGDHLDHVQHAFKFLYPGGVLVSVLPSSVEFRQDKRYVGFRLWVEHNMGEFTKLPAGSFKSSGTMVNAVVLRLVKA